MRRLLGRGAGIEQGDAERAVQGEAGAYRGLRRSLYQTPSVLQQPNRAAAIGRFVPCLDMPAVYRHGEAHHILRWRCPDA